MHDTSSAVAHQFDDLDQQHEATSLGMWIFLVTEIMFFGGLFLGYVVYRTAYPAAFAQASRHLDILLGGINTGILLCSSLTMALAVRAAQLGANRIVALFLIVTIFLGAAFLGIKFLEYYHKYEEGLIPGHGFHFESVEGVHAQIFFSFYFVMTAVHALHMIIGIALLAIFTALSMGNVFTPEYYGPVEVMGLYWHFIDIVWVFLFPLLYLVDRS